MEGGKVEMCTGRYLMQDIESGARRRTQMCRAEPMNYKPDQDAEVRKGDTGQNMQVRGSTRHNMMERFYGACTRVPCLTENPGRKSFLADVSCNIVSQFIEPCKMLLGMSYLCLSWGTVPALIKDPVYLSILLLGLFSSKRGYQLYSNYDLAVSYLGNQSCTHQ